jgi:hypothetical protein
MGVHAIRVGLAVAAAALVAACSPQGYFELDNRSGQDVSMTGPNGPQNAPAGAVTGRLALGAQRVISAGACTYSYANLAIAGATPREEQPFLSGPASSYHLRLEPDFSLRLFNVRKDGNLGAEVMSPGWPARPTVECRSTG